LVNGNSKLYKHTTGMCFSNIKECDEEHEQDTEEDDFRGDTCDQN
jgi:hypothetical protein